MITSVDRTLENLGYYLVDGRHKFYSRNPALIYCSEHKTQDIRFILNDSSFSTTDWTKEPQDSLKELYRKRAQQLRDRYDYVILAFSGGSDSLNMLHSFVENGIMPDEVISFVNTGTGFTEDHKANTEIFKNKHVIKEYIEKHEILYTLSDMSQHYASIFDDPYWFMKGGTIRPITHAKFHAQYLDRYRDIKNKGRSCCIVYGFEKPRVTYDGKKFHVFFLDSQHQNFHNDLMYSSSYDGPDLERFYVTPDMPEVTIKQSHVVAKYFRTTHTDNEITQILINDSTFRDGPYKKLCNRILYHYKIDDDQLYTEGKGHLGTSASPKDDWLTGLSGGHSILENIRLGRELLTKNIDKKFFTQGKNYDTVCCITRYYCLGEVR